jgi:hypothetical protein
MKHLLSLLTMNFSLKRCHLDLDLLEGRPNAAASEENEGNISVLIFENQRQTFLQAIGRVVVLSLPKNVFKVP